MRIEPLELISVLEGLNKLRLLCVRRHYTTCLTYITTTKFNDKQVNTR